MKHTVRLFVFFLLVAAWGQAAEFQVQRVIGTEFPGQYKHPASVTELANGDLYLAYYSGSGEYGDDTAVYGMRLAVGQDTWTEPVVIADTPDISEGNPVVWQAPDGLVWLFYVNRYGETWSHSRVKFKISRNGAQTWSDSSILTWELGTMVRGQPIVLLDGDYLLPLYWEAGEDREQSAPETTSFFMRYNPQEKTWKSTNRIHSPEGNLQAQVAQLDENYLVAYLRRGGNFEPTDTGFLLRAESRDGGWTWSDAVPTSFPNPNSAVDFIRLKNGHLLVVYNNNMNDRTPLSVALSTDNDQTYPYRMDLLTGENTFAYPYAIQTRDEKIHIVYTTNERTQIMHLTLDEEVLLRHRVE